MSGFILWDFSEFLSLRGVVSLAASRIILLLIWVAGTLGACVVVRTMRIGRKVLAVFLSSVVLACSLLALDLWAPKPSVPSETTSESPIEKTDSFSTLVPFQGESKNSPIPIEHKRHGSTFGLLLKSCRTGGSSPQTTRGLARIQRP